MSVMTAIWAVNVRYLYRKQTISAQLCAVSRERALPPLSLPLANGILDGFATWPTSPP
jgi:hypothetical protein